MHRRKLRVIRAKSSRLAQETDVTVVRAGVRYRRDEASDISSKWNHKTVGTVGMRLCRLRFEGSC